MSIFCTACSHENDEADGPYCEQCGRELPLSTAGPATGSLLAGRYEILGKISEGGMGSIFKARDTRLGTIVAVKQMHVHSIDPAELPYFEKRFREEAQILSSLHHSGIPKVTDFFTVQDARTGAQVHSLVMTFIEGATMASVIAGRGGKPFAVDEAMARFRQVLDILGFLHGQTPPVIHRDLNPRNIMMDGERVYLVDFGLARIFTPRRTNSTQPMGTAGYAPPEQMKGCADHRSDLYSLGVVMHYLLTGADPEDSSRKLFIFQPPSEINTTVPPGLSELIMAMVSIDPDRRPATAADVMARLSVPPSSPAHPAHGAPAIPAAGQGTAAPAHASSPGTPAAPLSPAPPAQCAPYRPPGQAPAPIPVQRKPSRGQDAAIIAVIAGLVVFMIIAASTAFLIGFLFSGNRPSTPVYPSSPIDSNTLFIQVPTGAPEPAVTGESSPGPLTPQGTEVPLPTQSIPSPLPSPPAADQSPAEVTPTPTAIMTPAWRYTQKQPGVDPTPSPSLSTPSPQATGAPDDPGVPGTIDGQGSGNDTGDPGIPGEIY